MLTVLAFFATIGVIVTIHEYGHFQVARWCGVKVLRFSVGFGKPLWKKTFGQDKTEFVLAAIPLGGYVKMLDENELKAEAALASEGAPIQYAEAELKRAFNRQSLYKRMAIVVAGPVANLLLAIAIYWFLLMQGVVGMRPVVGEVKAGSIAAQANLATGDVIQKIGDNRVKTWQEARWLLLRASLESKTVAIETVNKNQTLQAHTLNFAGIDDNADVDVLQKIGLAMFRPEVAAVLGEILAGSAAEKAGLKPNDQIMRIDNLDVKDWDMVVNTVMASPNKALLFKIMRGEEAMQLSVTPEASKDGKKTIGRIGAAVKVDAAIKNQYLIETKYTKFEGLQKAMGKTWEISTFSLKMLGYMVTGKTSIKGISGPVTTAAYAGESASLGLKPFLEFLALVSISIGVLNLLPIPVLDGGHLMYYIVEMIKGSPLAENTMLGAQKIGFALIGLLMTIAIFNDINRLIAG